MSTASTAEPQPRRRTLAPVADAENAATLTRAMTYAVLIGLFVAGAWMYREAYYQGLPFPKNTFLFVPGSHFGDLYDFFKPLQAHDPLNYPYAVYPPFSYIVMEPFVWAGYQGSIVLWVGLAAVAIGGFLARQLSFLPPIDRIAAVFALTFATYPFLISLDRGNIELVITVLLVALAWAWQTDRWVVAALAIGAMTAMKGYPIIFAAPLLVGRQWRALALCIVSAGLLTVLGSIYYNFDVVHTWNLLHARLTFYNDTYVIGDAGLAYGCSLFGPLKLLLVDVLGGDAATVRSAIPYYEAATVVILAGSVWVLWRRRLALWQQMTLLVCLLNLLPTVSGGYKLLHLVIPIGLFLRDGSRDPFRWVYMLLFALLMIPKAYFFFRLGGSVSDIVVLDPLLMTLLVVLVVVSAFRTREETAEPAPAAAAATEPGYSPA
ncbi:glycosyltransferase family 87 protein [Conexibacter woesei]|uniref:glycosyltransferase family 87 protein n=1 Tax=Conexibacter woesei TaxID=191495 RepID=UPI0003F7BF3C|nr:glycosyltransferase family 87 protein [Conexibacter woesei]